MWSLPDDLIGAILLRLPAVDLVRCKSVCKVWRSLISSADFVGAHLERAKSDLSSHHLLLVRDRLSGQVTDPFSSFGFFTSKDLLFVGSVNGLICVSGKEYTPYQNLTPHDIWIFNPVTGLSQKLPYSSRLFLDDRFVKFAFWCDEDGVYKLAKLLSKGFESVLELWVSTSPDTWTVMPTITYDFGFGSFPLHACDVLIEGVAAYWICGCEFKDDYERDFDSVVVSLDLKTLALGIFIPQWYKTNTYCWKAHDGYPNSVLFGGNLNGEFVLVAIRPSADVRYYDVWALVKDDATGAQGWINKFIICLDSFRYFKGLGIANDKLVLTSFPQTAKALYDPLTADAVVGLCDPFTGMLEGVETLSNRIRVNSARGFLGSLVSMEGFGFKWNDLLHQNIDIRWPYSLYPSPGKGDWNWRMKSSKKQRIHRKNLKTGIQCQIFGFGLEDRNQISNKIIII